MHTDRCSASQGGTKLCSYVKKKSQESIFQVISTSQEKVSAGIPAHSFLVWKLLWSKHGLVNFTADLTLHVECNDS